MIERKQNIGILANLGFVASVVSYNVNEATRKQLY